MTLANVNPTILEECQLCMHVDRVENILFDRYFVEFAYDPTCNYYERGKYGCRNFYLTKLPLVMLRLLSSLCSSLHMLIFACYDNLFFYKMPMHRKMLDLDVFFTCFHDALFALQFLSFMRASLKSQCLAKKALKKSACWETTQNFSLLLFNK